MLKLVADCLPESIEVVRAIAGSSRSHAARIFSESSQLERPLSQLLCQFGSTVRCWSASGAAVRAIVGLQGMLIAGTHSERGADTSRRLAASHTVGAGKLQPSGAPLDVDAT